MRLVTTYTFMVEPRAAEFRRLASQICVRAVGPSPPPKFTSAAPAELIAATETFFQAETSKWWLP